MASKPDGLAEIFTQLMKENRLFALKKKKTHWSLDNILKNKNIGDNHENVS